MGTRITFTKSNFGYKEGEFGRIDGYASSEERIFAVIVKDDGKFTTASIHDIIAIDEQTPNNQ